MDNFVIIPLSDDPEQMAQDLIADSLPKTFLDEIDISNEAGLSRLFACLLLRRQQASIEKDELVRFVERNRQALNSGAYQLLKTMEAAIGTGGEEGENLRYFLNYFNENVGHVLAGHPEQVDLKSDRLLWLLYALAHHLEGAKISYQKALAVLAKPEHRARISPLTLGYLYSDYAETIGDENQPSTEYPMMILECALISKDARMVKIGALILARQPAPSDGKAWLDLARRTQAYLNEQGLADAETIQFLRNAEKRNLRQVADDDF